MKEAPNQIFSVARKKRKRYADFIGFWLSQAHLEHGTRKVWQPLPNLDSSALRESNSKVNQSFQVVTVALLFVFFVVFVLLVPCLKGISSQWCLCCGIASRRRGIVWVWCVLGHAMTWSCSRCSIGSRWVARGRGTIGWGGAVRGGGVARRGGAMRWWCTKRSRRVARRGCTRGWGTKRSRGIAWRRGSRRRGTVRGRGIARRRGSVMRRGVARWGVCW
mmetsp:Transcript_25380/g.68937  ORF Transcript_25380/g.68937 Transcript_25380/m.68937 type:complete len:219 (+) Transcript_25380:152-808(+)